MPAGKMDDRSGADNGNKDSSRIVRRPRGLLCRPQAATLPSALWREQNPATLVRACNRAHSSEYEAQRACCFASPDRRPASHIPAIRDDRAAAELPATLDGCKAAAPAGTEPGLRSPAERCPP